MKKLMLLFGAAAALSASAASPIIIQSTDIDLTPQSMATLSGGLISIALTNDDRGKNLPYGLKVYNQNFDELADITFPTPKTASYTFTSGSYTKTETEDLTEVVPIAYFRDGIEYYGFYPTETLFNNDSQIEYVVANKEKVTFSYETKSGSSQSGEILAITSYSIMNQNGSKVLDIVLPEGYYAPKWDPDLGITEINEKLYIAIEARTNPSSDCYADHTIFYELDSTGGIKSPKILKGSMRVSPAAPRHGETVNVDLGSEASGATLVNIVSANGSTVRSIPVEAGRRNVALPTAGLASGLYIVTANGREAAKIIIR